MFKGREMAYQEKGMELLERFVEKVEDVGKIESEAKMEERNLNIILVPIKTKSKKKNK